MIWRIKISILSLQFWTHIERKSSFLLSRIVWNFTDFITLPTVTPQTFSQGDSTSRNCIFLETHWMHPSTFDWTDSSKRVLNVCRRRFYAFSRIHAHRVCWIHFVFSYVTEMYILVHMYHESDRSLPRIFRRGIFNSIFFAGYCFNSPHSWIFTVKCSWIYIFVRYIYSIFSKSRHYLIRY